MQKLLTLSAHIAGQRITAAVILFTTAFLYYLLIFHTQDFPIVSPDGEYYLLLAGDILRGSFPNSLVRSPVYPLFLAPFLSQGNLHLLVYAQMLLSCGSVYLVFLLGKKLISDKGIPFLLALVCIFDFNFYQFQYLVLTESLANFLLLLFLYLQLKASSPTASRTLLACNLVTGMVLVFLRPLFILLPAGLYLLTLIFHRKQSQSHAQVIRYCRMAIAAHVIVIAGWCFLNQYRYGEFTFSSVSKINMLGKTLAGGCIAGYSLHGNDTEAVKETVRFVHETNPLSPYDILNHLETKGIRVRPDSLSRVFLSGKWIPMLENDSRNFFRVLSRESHPYISVPAIKSYSFLLYASFLVVDKIKSPLSIFIFLSILVLLKLRKSAREMFLPVSFLAATVFYTLIMSVLFSYSEFSRLGSPAELPVNLLLLVVFTRISDLKPLFNSIR